MLGNALFTTVTSSSSMNTAMQTTPSVHHLLPCCGLTASAFLSDRGAGRSLGLRLGHRHDAPAENDHQRGAQRRPGDEHEDRSAIRAPSKNSDARARSTLAPGGSTPPIVRQSPGSSGRANGPPEAALPRMTKRRMT